MKSGIIQRIFSDHYDSYRQGRRMSPREEYAANAIMTCRTQVQGYHINACPNGDYVDVVANSCGHRACPQCGATDTQLWLERQKAKVLNCRYFQVVFTISHDLHPLWHFNRKLFTHLMMSAAWHTLRELLLDFRHLGGLVGAIGVFQSWDDEMRDHCHLHFIVSAGGLNSDDRWVSARNDFLVPTPVLAAKFRGKFLVYLKAGFSRKTPSGQTKPETDILRPPTGMTEQQCLNLFNKLGRKRWHAQIEPPYEHANGVFKYVGRYIRRGPISEKRIVRYDGESITMAYAHEGKHDQLTFTLSAHDFIRRILNHVPEKGTHVVRSYGLFHPNCQKKLDVARKLLNQGPYVPKLHRSSALELLERMFPARNLGRCPHCKTGLRTIFICRGGQAPAGKLAA